MTRPVLNAADRAAHYPGIPAPAPAQALPSHWRLAGLSIALVLTGCGDSDNVRTASPARAPRDWAVNAPRDAAAANAVLMRAISLVGTPYLYGGNTPDSGFDCSGLVNYVYTDMLDLRLPRTSGALAGFQGPRIALGQLAAADLVFFGTAGSVTHVGIYIGQGRFIHAPTAGGTVRLDHLDGSYWRDHYSGARRLLK